ncbi:MAG: hypothetical protein ABF335_04905 [Alphaproteobacteria bacterium]
MKPSVKYLVPVLVALLSGMAISSGYADTTGQSSRKSSIDQPIENMDVPLYSPFTARYLLDEVRSLRTQVERQRADLIERQVSREYEVAREAAGYARNAVELFFFIIIGVTTLLVFLGWTSLRDIRARVQSIAENRVGVLVEGYSDRLDVLEQQLHVKSEYLKETQAEIDVTNEIQSLWLRAGQESSPGGKIEIYDEILRIRPQNVEALTFKADAALELNETQWALSLTNKAIAIDDTNAHTFFQRACANACHEAYDDAISDFKTAIELSETYRAQGAGEPAFEMLRQREDFQILLRGEGEHS